MRGEAPFMSFPHRSVSRESHRCPPACLPAHACTVHTCARMPTSRVPREHAVGVAYVYAMRMGGGWMEAYLDCLVGPPSRSKPSVSQPCFARSHCQS